MTIVAYRDGTIAADSGFSIGGDPYPAGGRMKIVRNAEGWLCGTAGSSAVGDRFKEWFLAGSPPGGLVLVNGDDFHGAIIHPDGEVRVYEDESGHHNPWTCRPPYFAIGSGSSVALGAMFAGASAEDAVRAAIEHVDTCRGTVVSLSRHNGKPEKS